MKIKKGDKVEITSGKDKGRTGKVVKVLPKTKQLVIKGLNIAKKHIKAQGEKKPGGIISVEKPLHASKVMVVCPQCGKKTRVGFQLDKEGRKYRMCRKCQSLIDKAKTKKK